MSTADSAVQTDLCSERVEWPGCYTGRANDSHHTLYCALKCSLTEEDSTNAEDIANLGRGECIKQHQKSAVEMLGNTHSSGQPCKKTAC